MKCYENKLQMLEDGVGGWRAELQVSLKKWHCGSNLNDNRLNQSLEDVEEVFPAKEVRLSVQNWRWLTVEAENKIEHIFEIQNQNVQFSELAQSKYFWNDHPGQEAEHCQNPRNSLLCPLPTNAHPLSLSLNLTNNLTSIVISSLLFLIGLLPKHTSLNL